MMRIDSLMQRGWALRALALAAVLGSAACNEANGTEEWPGVYPPEEEIDRPKGGDAAAPARDAGGGGDSGARDGGAGDGGEELDAGADDAAADDDGAADDGGPSDAGADASRRRDGGGPSA